jgi:hypothetical protein
MAKGGSSITWGRVSVGSEVESMDKILSVFKQVMSEYGSPDKEEKFEFPKDDPLLPVQEPEQGVIGLEPPMMESEPAWVKGLKRGRKSGSADEVRED